MGIWIEGSIGDLLVIRGGNIAKEFVIAKAQIRDIDEMIIFEMIWQEIIYLIQVL